LSFSRSAFPHHLLALGAALLVFTACAASNDLGGKSADTASQGPGGSGGTGTQTHTGTTPQTDPQFFSIDGLLAVRDGNVDAAISGLTFAYAVDEDTILCTASYPIESSVPPAVTDPDVDVFGWWTLTLGAGSDCQTIEAPETLTLGIGPYDPLLDPAADRQGYDPATIYGLYMTADEPFPVVVFGGAGTNEQLAGEVPLQETAPLEDNNYLIFGLHYLPY
jgi:hypothetical protein